jgi:alkanesulfonate monooxygenase SsuD/methylene tetrahydromethanopterin reductase-like flavin-dependent oxidoreductase (luciferase family)
MPRPLDVGVQLPEVERHVPWTEYVAMALAAEEVGFDSIWVGDHLLYRGDGRPERGPRDAWTLLAGLAAVTGRVRLGPLVACLAFHPPGLIARMAAGVHELSGGRFVLGVGAGWNEVEFRAFGIPFDHRAARFAESFEIVRGLLHGERVTFHGRFLDVEDAVLLPPASQVPLMVGSVGDRVLRAALPYADAWNTWFADYGNTPEGFARANGAVSRIADEVGRDPASLRRSACVFVVLDRAGPERPLEAARPVEGTPDRIADALRSMAEAGADEAILVVSPITERSIRTLGEVLGHR